MNMHTPAPNSPPGESDWRRRQALCLASQLPENVTDAIVVLDLLKEIVVSFLHVDLPEPEKAHVVMLVRSRPDPSA
jgi:hypothetical protein